MPAGARETIDAIPGWATVRAKLATCPAFVLGYWPRHMARSRARTIAVAAAVLGLLLMFLWSFTRQKPIFGFGQSVPAPPALPAPARAPAMPSRISPPGQTALRLVDDAGNPVEGVPIFEGEPLGIGKLFFKPGSVVPSALGTSDANGIYVPLVFPVTLGVGDWPANPPTVALTDDGREHVMVVTPACEVALSWALPPGPNPIAFVIPGAENLPIAPGEAVIRVPCGVVPVGVSSSGDHPSSSVELVNYQFDSRQSPVRLLWQPIAAITLCISDEEGNRLTQATVRGSWKVGDCSAIDARHVWCQEVTSEGFLDASVCPESGDGWVKTRYDVALERGRKVHYDCLKDDGTEGCDPSKFMLVNCVSRATPDSGSCLTDTQTCICPDEPDAYLVASFGEFAGERAEIVGTEARFKHTGTASITVPGSAFCNAQVSRRDEDVRVFAGLLRCDRDGAAARRLLPGNYTLVVASQDSVSYWSNILVAAGEQKVVPLSFPTGSTFAVQWPENAPVLSSFTVRRGNLFQQFDSIDSVVVPSGAEVWVATPEGGCYYRSPPAEVTCAADESVQVPAAP